MDIPQCDTKVIQSRTEPFFIGALLCLLFLIREYLRDPLDFL